MEIRHCLHVYWLVVIVNARAVDEQVDRKVERCGSEIANALHLICQTYNEIQNDTKGESNGGDIVTQCCHNPCSLIDMMAYCSELKPKYNYLLNAHLKSLASESREIPVKSLDASTHIKSGPVPFHKIKPVSKPKYLRGCKMCKRRRNHNKLNHNCRKIRGATHKSRSSKLKKMGNKKRLCDRCAKTRKMKKHSTRSKYYHPPSVGMESSPSSFIINTPYTNNQFLGYPFNR